MLPLVVIFLLLNFALLALSLRGKTTWCTVLVCMFVYQHIQTCSSISKSASGCPKRSSVQLSIVLNSATLTVICLTRLVGGVSSPSSGGGTGIVTKNCMHSVSDDNVAIQSELSLLNVVLIRMNRLKKTSGLFCSALKKKRQF